MADWSTARPDWETRIKARLSLLPDGLPIDRARADRALRIFKRLRMHDVHGQPRIGDVAPQWLIDLVEAIFGTYDSGLRRQLIREFFVCVAKKNGKSSFAAGVMLTALVMHSRHGEEFLILSPTKDIADNSFIPAYNMVKLDRELLKAYKPSEFTREIVNRLDGSILAVKSADADVIGGQKATSILVDELWLFGKRAAAKNILSEATGSQAARPEGFALYLTTQSDDPPAGVFADTLNYFRSVRDGKRIDRNSLALIYEYPPDMQRAQAWRDPTTWYIPNPSIGRSVDPQWIEGQLAKEEAKGLDSLRLFCAKHFNIQVDIGLRSDGWAGAELWDRGVEKGLTLDAILERCEVVTVGADGGGLDDLFGFGVIGRERETKRWLAWARAWISPEGLQRRKANASVYEGFIADGDLTVVEKLPQDVEAAVALVKRIDEAGLLAKVGIDAIGIGSLVDALAGIGITASGEQDDRLGAIRQGIALMGSIKTVERKLADGSFRHGGSRMMAWCVGNAKVVPTPTAMRIARDESGYGKIDPLMALFNAAALMAMNPVVAPQLDVSAMIA